MAGVIRLQTSLLKRILPLVQRRHVSTSKKNNETINITNDEQCKTAAEVPVVTKNWVSYGFDTKSEKGDRSAMNMIFFSSVTVCLVFGALVFAYVPDYSLRDWAQREAYLVLKCREEKGLPAIDPNLIDPSKIQLPSDEELGDMEIII